MEKIHLKSSFIRAIFLQVSKTGDSSSLSSQVSKVWLNILKHHSKNCFFFVKVFWFKPHWAPDQALGPNLCCKASADLWLKKETR